MQAALSGYLTIWSVIGVGWLVAHFRVLNEQHRRMLSRVAFTVASPVLLFSLLSRADLGHVFSTTIVVSALAIVIGGLVYLVAARVFFGPGDLAGRVIGTLCSIYTNAGNLGLPVAAYVLGDMTWMAPILLIQVGVLQPTALALLDLAAARGQGRRLSPLRYLTLPLRNPLTLGSIAGLLVNALHVPVPEVLWPPIEMVGQVAVPAMLLAFGISLRLDPLPGRGPHAGNSRWSRRSRSCCTRDLAYAPCHLGLRAPAARGPRRHRHRGAPDGAEHLPDRRPLPRSHAAGAGRDLHLHHRLDPRDRRRLHLAALSPRVKKSR